MSRTKKEKDDKKREEAAKNGKAMVGENHNRSPAHGSYSKGRLLLQRKAKRVSKSKLAGLTFPVGRFGRKLRKEDYVGRMRISETAPVYMTAVIEYLIAEIFNTAKVAAVVDNRKRITPQHINLAIKNDAELGKLLQNVTVAGGGVVPFIHPVLTAKPKRKPASKKKKTTKKAPAPTPTTSADESPSNKTESAAEEELLAISKPKSTPKTISSSKKYRPGPLSKKPKVALSPEKERDQVSASISLSANTADEAASTDDEATTDDEAAADEFTTASECCY